jgi:hypothetical protein
VSSAEDFAIILTPILALIGVILGVYLSAQAQLITLDRERRSKAYSRMLALLTKFEGRVEAYLQLEHSILGVNFVPLTPSQRLPILSKFESAINYLGLSGKPLSRLADVVVDGMMSREYCTDCIGAFLHSFPPMKEEFNVAHHEMRFSRTPKPILDVASLIFGRLDGEWVSSSNIHDRTEFGEKMDILGGMMEEDLQTVRWFWRRRHS